MDLEIDRKNRFLFWKTKFNGYLLVFVCEINSFLQVFNCKIKNKMFCYYFNFLYICQYFEIYIKNINYGR